MQPVSELGFKCHIFLVSSLSLPFNAGAASHVPRFSQFPHWVDLKEVSQGILLTSRILAP